MKYFVYAFSALALISTATLTEASDQAKKEAVLKAMKPLGVYGQLELPARTIKITAFWS